MIPDEIELGAIFGFSNSDDVTDGGEEAMAKALLVHHERTGHDSDERCAFDDASSMESVIVASCS
jgi:hypothetical protein